jgi:hypothetical protein
MLSAEYSCHSSKSSSAAIKIAASGSTAYSAAAVKCWYRNRSCISANTATANFACAKNATYGPNKSVFEVLTAILKCLHTNSAATITTIKRFMVDIGNTVQCFLCIVSY